MRTLFARTDRKTEQGDQIQDQLVSLQILKRIVK